MKRLISYLCGFALLSSCESMPSEVQNPSLPPVASDVGWEQTSLDSVVVTALALTGTDLYAGTDEGQIFLSTDGGTSWRAVSPGLGKFRLTALAVSGEKVCAGGYINPGPGLSPFEPVAALSPDGGSTWVRADSGLGQRNTMVMSLVWRGDRLFAGLSGYYADGGVYVTTDYGSNWNNVSPGSYEGSHSLAVCPSGTGGVNLLVGIVPGGGGGGGVFRSTDNGTSWTAVNAGLANVSVRSLAASSTDLFAATDGGVFHSLNNTFSWTSVNQGLAAYQTIERLALSGVNCFGAPYSGGVFLRTAKDTSWRTVNSGLTNLNVRSLAVSGGTIFAGTGAGVFRGTIQFK